MRLTLTQFVTLDGVYQGPGSADEDTSDGFARGGWMVPHMDQAFIELAAGWLAQADALLLGRRTYQAFARDWPQITDPDDPFTKSMNGLPKYVASNTLTEATWAPTTILRGDVVQEVAKLKAGPGREWQVHGSARLAQSLLAAGLIDEVRMVITPTVLGQGRRLFPDHGPAIGMRVTGHSTTPGGLTILILEATSAPQFATYEGVGAVPR
ncbi:deaminase reductase [Rhizocola hellebori]|uniref:Deaminase reductase n=1 Tax=Rhizocola hellebori TaxID=1392758 RepID=A0A8J3QEU3_9ACTN|nr:dihydrofolate reductase family protein [Rhizocola hellebori]GIH09436.1 deaminase reductase [Rhizocola hellebori]